MKTIAGKEVKGGGSTYSHYITVDDSTEYKHVYVYSMGEKCMNR